MTAPPAGVLHIACQARRDYVPHSAAMLHSVLTNGGMPAVHIHYLHGADLSEDDLASLRRLVTGAGGEITFCLITEDRVSGLAVSEQFPSSHWYRLFLPELLPELDRVLYLDCDLIVVDSLEPLWNTDLSEHYLAAVTNVFQDDHFYRIPMLGLDSPDVYFNSGVMLLNLEAMRRDDATASVLAWAQQHAEKLDWPEQDALNVVLGHRRLYLHPRWNMMNSIRRFGWSMHAFGASAVQEAKNNPAIRHFEGPGLNKPWNVLCDAESKALYLQHRRQTPWPNVQLEGKIPGRLDRLRHRLKTLIRP